MGIYTRDNLPMGVILSIASSQGWSIPSTGQIKNGLALCDGQPFSSLPSGKYHPSFTGNRPNLTDSRFLLGNTTPGTASPAQNLIKLVSNNIPSISDTGGQSTGHSHEYGGSIGTVTINDENTGHIHNYSGSTLESGSNHTHYYEFQVRYWDHQHVFSDYRYQDLPHDQNAAPTTDDTGINVVDTRSTAIFGLWGSHNHTLVDGTISANHNHRYTGNTEYRSASHTHGSHSGYSGNGGSHNHTFGALTPSDVDNRPPYFSVVYVMKVK